MSSSLRFSDRVAVISGAASGIGAATARRFASEGAKVVLVDKDKSVKEVAQDLSGAALQSDVTERGAGHRIAKFAIDAFGRIDILVNNAGVGGSRALADTDDFLLDRIIGINLTALIRVTRDVVPVMTAPGGRIINTASILGLAGHPGTTAYAAAKAGVAQFTRQIAAELGPKGILVNAVAPGTIETPMIADRLESDAYYRKHFVEAVPLRRHGSPADVAAAIAFLASDDAAYIAGQVIAVDGGWIAARHWPRE